MRAASLPDWYVTAGCLFQTVWNVVTDRHPTNGIKDYDVFYFENRDLSWEAEDAVIKAAGEAFAGLPAEVEVRNEARVHLWYEQKFGVACAPYASTEAPSTASRRPPAAWARRWSRVGGGASMRRTGSPRCSISSCVPIRRLPRARCTRPRPRAGDSSGPS